MKLNQSTTILLNVALVLLIALLAKSLLFAPKELIAKGKIEYKVLLAPGSVPAMQKLLNGYVEQGWKLHSYEYGKSFIFFERER